MKHNSPLELIHIGMSYKTAEELRSTEISEYAKFNSSSCYKPIQGKITI